tara:strand:- start:1722 stop:4604 length:2883 start_codon:yes stop_codon:yes gene_type:complete
MSQADDRWREDLYRAIRMENDRESLIEVRRLIRESFEQRGVVPTQVLLNSQYQMRNRQVPPALIVAVVQEKPFVIEYLMREGAEVSAADDDGNNALHWAAEWAKKIEVMNKLLYAIEEDVLTKRNLVGETPMDKARRRSGAIGGLMIRAITNAISTSKMSLVNAIYFRTSERSKGLEEVEYLINKSIYDRGDSVTEQWINQFHRIPDGYPRYQVVNALMWAIMNQQHAIVKLLLENGADPSLSTQNGQNALHIAVLYSDYMQTINYVLESMLKNGMKDALQKKDLMGETPLDLAREKRSGLIGASMVRAISLAMTNRIVKEVTADEFERYLASDNNNNNTGSSSSKNNNIREPKKDEIWALKADPNDVVIIIGRLSDGDVRYMGMRQSYFTSKVASFITDRKYVRDMVVIGQNWADNREGGQFTWRIEHIYSSTSGMYKIKLRNGENRETVSLTTLLREFKFKESLRDKYKRQFPQSKPLVVASELGKLDDVIQLIEEGEDVNVYGKDRDGARRYPLMAAAATEQVEVVKLLLEKGADARAMDSDERNTLYWAASNNKKQTDVVKMLLEKIQTEYPAYAIEYINQLSKKGITPLDAAYELNDSNPVKKEIIRLIRAAGGKSFNRDASGKFVGDGKGDLHSYEYVYASYKRKYPNSDPLIVAIEQGGYRDMKSLATNQNINKVGKSSGGGEHTPLQMAVGKERLAFVKYILSLANPNTTNNKGENALHYAAWHSETNTDVIQVLLDAMADYSINKKDAGGYTPLDKAYKYNRSPLRQEIITLLRSKGAKANAHDIDGNEVATGDGDLTKTLWKISTFKRLARSINIEKDLYLDDIGAEEEQDGNYDCDYVGSNKKNPVILNCGHIWCLSEIKDLATRSNQPKCPLCRQNITTIELLRQKDIDELETVIMKKALEDNDKNIKRLNECKGYLAKIKKEKEDRKKKIQRMNTLREKHNLEALKF